MKRFLIAGIIGFAGVGYAFAQGFIRLDSYISSPSTLVTYGYNVPANGISGPYGTLGSGLNSSWTVGIYFASGVVGADSTEGIGLVSPTLNLATGQGSTTTFDPFSPYSPGLFSSPYGFNTGLPAGSIITVELVAYPTSTGNYASAIYRAHSAAFTLTTTDAINPNYTPANASFTVGPSMSSFFIGVVPEPGTLALFGMGGVCILSFLRRRIA
jgi:hypothetical protein